MSAARAVLAISLLAGCDRQGTTTATGAATATAAASATATAAASAAAAASASAAASATAAASAAATATATAAAAAAASGGVAEGGEKAAKFMEDLNNFCVFTQVVKADPAIPKEKRSVEILGRLIASRPGPEFLKFLRDMGDTPNLYRSLQQAAAARGATRWSCPALAD